MKVLGVCGGNGVILYPFKDNLVANIEPRSVFKTPGEEQWYSNFDCPVYRKAEHGFLELPKNLKPDLIVGAPDCGHSSVLSLSRRKSFTNPKENESLNLYLESIKRYKPKFFLMENLTKMLEQFSITEWRERFPEYKLVFNNGPVTMYGNSQATRKRLVLVGIRKDQKIRSSVFKLSQKDNSTPKTYKQLTKTVGKQNLEFGHISEDENKIIAIYGGKKMSLGEIQAVWNSIGKEETRFPVQEKGRKFESAPAVYRNLFHRPPFTARRALRQFNPDGTPMTPRQLARVQGVPDEFKIYLNPDKLEYWLNKARTTLTKCPPYEIGEWFNEKIRKHATKRGKRKIKRPVRH